MNVKKAVCYISFIIRRQILLKYIHFNVQKLHSLLFSVIKIINKFNYLCFHYVKIAGNNRDRYVFINFLILISYYK